MSRNVPTSSSAEAASSDHVERSLTELMENARLLARHAVETGQLPRTVDVERMFAVRRRFELEGEISERDLSFFVRSYQNLERRMGPVTVDTLRATEWNQDQPCAASRYVHRLWWRTYLNIGLILGCHLFLNVIAHPTMAGHSDYWWIAALTFVTQYMIPFLYGALGADAFLIRETTQELRSRQFDPRRIPENAARFLLGTLSGGVVVLFVSPEVVNLIVNDDHVKWAMGSAALGFLAGYSNDFLFSVLERVMRAVSLRAEPEQSSPSRRDLAAEDVLVRLEEILERNAKRDEPDRVAWSRPPNTAQAGSKTEAQDAPAVHSSVEKLRTL